MILSIRPFKLCLGVIKYQKISSVDLDRSSIRSINSKAASGASSESNRRAWVAAVALSRSTFPCSTPPVWARGLHSLDSAWAYSLGFVAEARSMCRPQSAIGTRSVSDQSGLRIQLAGKGPVAIDPTPEVAPSDEPPLSCRKILGSQNIYCTKPLSR